MTAVILVVCGVALLFAVVVFVGAPYLPTMKPQVAAAFTLLDLKKGQTLLELGCGDGRVLIEAARRGYRAVGIELNLVLVLIALWRTRQYRKQVRVVWGNYWFKPWPESDGVYTFLINNFMPKLNTYMQSYGGKLVSVAFRIPGKQPVKEHDSVYLYDYKENVDSIKPSHAHESLSST